MNIPTGWVESVSSCPDNSRPASPDPLCNLECPVSTEIMHGHRSGLVERDAFLYVLLQALLFRYTRP